MSEKESVETLELKRGQYIISKLTANYETKKSIATCIVNNFIRNFDSVMLDAGSTAEVIAGEIFLTRKFISIITNNMGAYAAYMRAASSDNRERPSDYEFSQNELILTGGRYALTYESLLGDEARRSFENFSPNVVIIGVSGLRVGEGLFCHGEEEMAVKDVLCSKHADYRIIATDWNKIGRRDAHAFAEVEKLKAYAKKAIIVTNVPKTINSEEEKEFIIQRKQLEKLGIEVWDCDNPPQKK